VRFAKTHDKHNALPCVFRRRRAKLTTVRRRFPQPTLMSHGVARGVHVHTCLPCIFMCNARQRGLFAIRPWFCARQSFWRTTMVEFPVVKKDNLLLMTTWNTNRPVTGLSPYPVTHHRTSPGLLSTPPSPRFAAEEQGTPTAVPPHLPMPPSLFEWNTTQHVCVNNAMKHQNKKYLWHQNVRQISNR
jgi:hypothetical protein